MFDETTCEDLGGETEAIADGIADGHDFLVVEDNIIIGMDVEDMLGRLGARSVKMAETASAALHILETSNIDLAVLDVNLGDETCEAVARALAGAGKPFVFASGYDEGPAFAKDLGPIPIVRKPYGIEGLRSALDTLKAPTA